MVLFASFFSWKRAEYAAQSIKLCYRISALSKRHNPMLCCVCLHAPLCKQCTTTEHSVCFPYCQCLWLTCNKKRKKQILANHKFTFNQFVIFVEAHTSWINSVCKWLLQWIMLMDGGGCGLCVCLPQLRVSNLWVSSRVNVPCTFMRL